MATQRTSFAKLQRDRDKQAKAAAKRDRRQQRSAPNADGGEEVTPETVSGGEGELSAAELLTLVETVHRQYEAKEIDFETYEETKAALLARLSVD